MIIATMVAYQAVIGLILVAISDYGREQPDYLE